jgi:hypothetical protein
VALIRFIQVNSLSSINIYINALSAAFKGQVALRSWFPLPTAWEANRSGCNWLDWTERCEEIFLNIMDGVHDGTTKPKSHAEWVSFLRGQSTSRILIKQNNARSQAFLDKVVPPP